MQRLLGIAMEDLQDALIGCEDLQERVKADLFGNATKWFEELLEKKRQEHQVRRRCGAVSTGLHLRIGMHGTAMRLAMMMNMST
jgi:hypothetical protein